MNNQQVAPLENSDSGLNGDVQATLTDQSNVVLSLDEMIKAHIASIEKMREELKKHREMLEDTYANDPSYREKTEEVKKVQKARLEVKQRIMQQPSVSQISAKVRSTSAELKEKQTALSDYLLEYQRLSGANQIEGLDGQVREIVQVARLVKKTS